MNKNLSQYLDAIISLQKQLLEAFLGTRETSNEEEWVDNADVKQLLKISDATLYRLRRSGQLVSKKIGGKWYYLKSVIVPELKQR